jgi:hypothetical protein
MTLAGTLGPLAVIERRRMDSEGRVLNCIGPTVGLSGSLCQQRLVCDRRVHLTAAVSPGGVVGVDESGDGFAGIGLGRKALARQQFEFEGRVPTFTDRVGERCQLRLIPMDHSTPFE